MDHQAELVEPVVLDQRPDELDAPVDQDVPAGLLLWFPDFVRRNDPVGTLRYQHRDRREVREAAERNR